LLYSLVGAKVSGSENVELSLPGANSLGSEKSSSLPQGRLWVESSSIDCGLVWPCTFCSDPFSLLLSKSNTCKVPNWVLVFTASAYSSTTHRK